MARKLRPEGTRYAVGLWIAYACFFLLLPVCGALDPNHLAGVIVGAGLFVLVFPFIWRSGVYVTSDGLTSMPVSGRQKSYPWSDIKSFEVGDAESVFTVGVHIVRTDGTRVELPSTTSTPSQRAKVERICEELEAARAQAHAIRLPTSVPVAEPDLRGARATLAALRPKLVLIAAAAITVAAAGALGLDDPQFWGLAASGVVVLAGLVPIQMGLRAIDRQIADDESPAGLGG